MGSDDVLARGALNVTVAPYGAGSKLQNFKCATSLREDFKSGGELRRSPPTPGRQQKLTGRFRTLVIDSARVGGTSSVSLEPK